MRQTAMFRPTFLSLWLGSWGQSLTRGFSFLRTFACSSEWLSANTPANSSAVDNVDRRNSTPPPVSDVLLWTLARTDLMFCSWWGFMDALFPRPLETHAYKIRWTCLLLIRTCRMELFAEWPSDDNYTNVFKRKLKMYFYKQAFCVA